MKASSKGGVEGEVGYFRRNHLVPVPQVSDWGHLIDHCQFSAGAELARHLDGRAQSVGETWASERDRLRPLPAEPFDTRLHYIARVDPKGRVTVLRNRYSVPVVLCGLAVDVAVSSTELVVLRDGREVARHQRLAGIGGDRLKLDHYLEVLRYKPRAFAGSLALHQGIADGSFPPTYVAFHRRLVERLGESEGARQMVDVLFLHRQYGSVVVTAVERALAAGAYDHAAVALIARQLAEPPPPSPHPPRLHVLHSPDVPVPDCRKYDQLLSEED